MVDRPASIQQAIAMFEAMPGAAHLELADMLGRFGRDALAIQQGRVPKAKGLLASALSSQLSIDNKLVRLRVGLLGGPATSSSARRRAAKAGGTDPSNLGDAYYGRFVEFGRTAQTVLRKRRASLKGSTSPENMKRRLRDGVGQSKALRVGAMAPRPYVNPMPDGAITALLDERLQGFLDRVLTRAEGS